MSTAPGRQPAPAVPGAVKVRVSVDLPGIAALLRVLRDAAGTAGLGADISPRLYPNRHEPGYRVYVVLRFPAGGDPANVRRAAHSHQAIRRPAAPRPVKESPGKRHHP